jgi:hypothetical protein
MAEQLGKLAEQAKRNGDTLQLYCLQAIECDTDFNGRYLQSCIAHLLALREIGIKLDKVSEKLDKDFQCELTRQLTEKNGVA